MKHAGPQRRAFVTGMFVLMDPMFTSLMKNVAVGVESMTIRTRIQVPTLKAVDVTVIELTPFVTVCIVQLLVLFVLLIIRNTPSVMDAVVVEFVYPTRKT